MCALLPISTPSKVCVAGMIARHASCWKQRARPANTLRAFPASVRRIALQGRCTCTNVPAFLMRGGLAACYTGCSSCTGSAATQCTGCSSGYTLIGGACIGEQATGDLLLSCPDRVPCVLTFSLMRVTHLLEHSNYIGQHVSGSGFFRDRDWLSLGDSSGHFVAHDADQRGMGHAVPRRRLGQPPRHHLLP